jgi:aspartyl/asparaginyl beta-hydroxylase (cupin superfamily)
MTMNAIRQLPLCDLPARAPSVLFSRLKPGAHIPPHCGLVNTRLIGHLPLVVPNGCEFRVGATTRTWKEGEAWVFDDSIEHEAWNKSSETRVILLFEIWRPEIGATEREAIRKLFHALDSLRGMPEDWEI